MPSWGLPSSLVRPSSQRVSWVCLGNASGLGLAEYSWLVDNCRSILSSSSLLWFGSSLWLCGLSSGGLLCGCGLLHSRLLVGGLLLGLGLWGSLRSSWLWLLLCELGSSGASLWLSKDTLLDTGLQGSVEQRIEHGICGVDLVVGSDILLEGDAA